MLDLNFRNELREHTFSRYNDYYPRVNTLLDSNILVSGYMKRVPLIYKEPGNFHSEEGFLRYVGQPQLRNRKVTKVQLAEIFNTAPIPIHVRFGDFHVLVGKGFLALYDPIADTMELLTVVLAPNKPGIELRDLDYIVDRKLYRTEHRLLQTAVGPLIDTHAGDTLITPNISKYIGEKIKVPKLSSISQRRVFVENLLDYSINKVKRELQNT